MVHVFVFHPTITFLAVLLSEQGREPSTNSTPTYVVTPRFEPGSHWWEASALTTAPSLPSKGKIAVAPLSSAQAPAWYPCENSNKRAGDYGKTLPLSIVPRALTFFPLPSPPAAQRGLCGGVS